MKTIELLTPREIRPGMMVTAWYNCGTACHAPLKVIKRTGKSSTRVWKDIICIDLADDKVPIECVMDTEFYFFSKFKESHRGKRFDWNNKRQVNKMKKQIEILKKAGW